MLPYLYPFLSRHLKLTAHESQVWWRPEQEKGVICCYDSEGSRMLAFDAREERREMGHGVELEECRPSIT